MSLTKLWTYVVATKLCEVSDSCLQELGTVKHFAETVRMEIAFTICGNCGVFVITLVWIVLNYLHLLSCLVVSIIAIHFVWYFWHWPHKSSACTESTSPPGDKVSSIYSQPRTASFPSLVASKVWNIVEDQFLDLQNPAGETACLSSLHAGCIDSFPFTEIKQW